MVTDSGKAGTVIVCVLTVILLIGCESAGGIQPDRYDLYLLIGQSNMAGRGDLEEIDKTPHERVWTMDQDGNWVRAVDPIHFDKPARVGVGPGLSFGKAMADHDTDSVIGLIPSAAGGSPIAAWQSGGYHNQTASYPYDDAIARARTAMRNGTLKAILWHQGESDSRSPEKVLRYRGALTDLAARLREDLDAPEVPFIVGELGGFLENQRPGSVGINQILQDVPNFIPNSGFVSVDGLTDKGDQVHFSSESARMLGRRYAEKVIELRATRNWRGHAR